MENDESFEFLNGLLPIDEKVKLKAATEEADQEDSDDDCECEYHEEILTRV